jgi:gliding motility-associated-like protein
MDGFQMVRLTFGNSLLNAPTAENLGNPGGFNLAGGLSVIRDCDLTSGYFTNYLTDGQLGKLIFSGGVTGSVTGEILGNIGNLDQPHSFSELFRQNDTLFAYITNRGSSTITRLTFPPCNNASVPSSTLFNPPPFSYDQPGTYNVRLLVNEGLTDQLSLCKSIVIVPVPTVDLGADRNICTGQSTILDAGAGFTTYLWSTGATKRTITVSTTGTYSVTVTQSGCSASDSVNVSSSITDCTGELWFPSAFTPNGDGMNDFFRPKGINIAKFHLTVYSRWGQMLFETEDMERGWDGSVKGILCPPDTYTFVATYEGTENPGKRKKVQGSFILMR